MPCHADIHGMPVGILSERVENCLGRGRGSGGEGGVEEL